MSYFLIHLLILASPCMNTQRPSNTHTHTHTHVHTNHTHTTHSMRHHTNTQTQTQTHTHICIHTQTQTHTYTPHTRSCTSAVHTLSHIHTPHTRSCTSAVHTLSHTRTHTSTHTHTLTEAELQVRGRAPQHEVVSQLLSGPVERRDGATVTLERRSVNVTSERERRLHTSAQRELVNECKVVVSFLMLTRTASKTTQVWTMRRVVCATMLRGHKTHCPFPVVQESYPSLPVSPGGLTVRVVAAPGGLTVRVAAAPRGLTMRVAAPGGLTMRVAAAPRVTHHEGGGSSLGDSP